MRNFFRSFTFAAKGLWFCLRHERNFRIHMAAGFYVLLLAPYFPLSRGEWAVLVTVIGLMLAAEALNTAVEQAVNLASPHRRTRARVAKDVAAGAVLLCAGAAIAVAAFLFWRPAAWAGMLADFRIHWWKPLALLLSLGPMLWFVFGGGRRKKG